jgi:hypothetical protein
VRLKLLAGNKVALRIHGVKLQQILCARSNPTVATFMMNAPLSWTSRLAHFGMNLAPLSGSRPSHQSPILDVCSVTAT